MKGAIRAGALALCLGAAAGCGGENEANIAEQNPQVSGRGNDAPTLVTVKGCLTASGDQFVLTDLQAGAAGDAARREQGGANPVAHAQPTTESYQLVGDADELRKLVGRQVQVSGPAEPPKVAEVREMTPPSEPSSATGTSGAPAPAKPGEPQVATTTETRLEVTQLRVESLTDMGEPCATAPPEQR